MPRYRLLGSRASEVLRDGLRLVEQRETEEAAKLEALREAARIGAAALDRGEWKEFESIEDLQTYLNEPSDKVMDATERGHLELRMIDAQDGDNWW